MAVNQKRVLVTGAGGPLGVNVTRSLQMAPEKLWLLGTEANPYHIHLALTDAAVLIPPAKQLVAYLEAMRNIVAQQRIDMIFPTHPVEVRTLATYRDSFPGVRFLLPPGQICEMADSKLVTYQKLQAAGVSVPLTWHIRTPEDLQEVFAKLPTRPIWVRGAGTPGAGIGVASLPCRELSHAQAWVDYWQGWGHFIASEFLPGRNLTWCGIYKKGELYVAQTRERLEYVIPHVSPSGITGAPAVSRTVHRADLHQLGDLAVRVLMPKPEGVFFVDFKEDAEKMPRVTEINAGRLGTTIHFYTVAGCNFPYLVLRLAFDLPIQNAPLIDPIADGVYWIRTLDCGPVLLEKLDDADP